MNEINDAQGIKINHLSFAVNDLPNFTVNDIVTARDMARNRNYTFEPMITMIADDMQIKMEDNLVVAASQTIGFEIDKERLLGALRWDSDQYHAGWQKGFNTGWDEAARFIRKILDNSPSVIAKEELCNIITEMITGQKEERQ